MDYKAILSDLIYQIHKKESFYKEIGFWAEPFVTFSASNERTVADKAPEFVRDLKKKQILREDVSDLICILGEWENLDICEGIFFTTTAIYVNSPKNEEKRFRVRYDDIKELDLLKLTNKLRIVDYDGKTHRITTSLWNAYAIKLFLEYASDRCQYTSEELKIVNAIELPHLNNIKFSSVLAGTVYGNVSNASTIYGEEKFHASQGHGFAAERANTLYDRAMGRDARILGDDNALNGADRMVDGVQIQSKYCFSGSKCISECFDNGKFRYLNADGTPMQIEVPADEEIYNSAIQSMKNRIAKGEVPGVTDPEEAVNIVRRGKFTYAQAKNIAKAGTIESLTYDSINGAIIASNAFGITAVVSFATAIWNGEDLENALKMAAVDGLKVSGVSFVTAVLAGQLTKAGLNSLMVGSSEAIVKVLGSKGSAVLVNALRQGKNIYGAAAMKSAAKLLRTNTITGLASVVILSTVDVVNLFNGRISGSQLFKNIVNTGASVAGGTAGWVGGAALGSALGPIGTVVGGILGALGGGAIAGEVADTVMGVFVEDDAKEMVRIIEEKFVSLVSDYLLTKREVEHVIDRMSDVLDGKKLMDMYSAKDRYKYAEDFIMPMINREIDKRKKIALPSQEAMQRGLRNALEELA